MMERPSGRVGDTSAQAVEVRTAVSAMATPTVTRNVSNGSGIGLNTAPTFAVSTTDIGQVDRPVQSPVHPIKTCPSSGVGVNVREVPESTVSVQSTAQGPPPADAATDPEPSPATSIATSAVPRAISISASPDFPPDPPI